MFSLSLHAASLYVASLHAASLHVVSLYVVSLHAASLYVASLHAASLYVASLHAVSLHVVSLYVASLHVASLHAASLHVVSLYVASLHVASLHAASLHVVSLHVASLHVASPHVVSLHVASHITVCCITACCRGEVDDAVWRFLLTGGVALENPHPNPFPDWLSEKSWGEIVRASSLPKLKGLMDKFDPRWKELYDSPSPHESPFPEPWESELKDLDRYHVHCIVGIVVALGTAFTVGEVHT